MKTKLSVNLIAKEFFQAGIITYLLLTLSEVYRKGFVTNYFNINYMLIPILLFGTLLALTDEGILNRLIRRRAARAVIVLTIRMHKRQLAYQQRLREKYEAQKAAVAAQRQSFELRRKERLDNAQKAKTVPNSKLQDIQFVHPRQRFVRTEAKNDYGRPFRPARHQQRSVDGIK
jgi:hypothetical protein